MKRACLRCAALTTNRSGICSKHPKGNTSYNGMRDRRTQAIFSAAVRARAGNRCEHRKDGVRCAAVRELEAHHIEPGNEDPAMGVLLCGTHHGAVDPYARGRA